MKNKFFFSSADRQTGKYRDNLDTLAQELQVKEYSKQIKAKNINSENQIFWPKIRQKKNIIKI